MPAAGAIRNCQPYHAFPSPMAKLEAQRMNFAHAFN
jgi:hypothetical protein